jgi:hypothetical protein
MAENQPNNGLSQEEQDFEKAVAHVKKEMEENKFSENIIEALGLAQSILESSEKVEVFDSMKNLSTELEMEFPEHYQAKLDEIQSEIEANKTELPEKVDAAFSDITQRRLLKLINFSNPGDKREDRDLKDPVKRIQRKTARYVLSQLTDEQKETIFHTLRAEEITKSDEIDMVFEFEQIVGYSLSFAKEHILTELDSDLEVFFGFLEKHIKGYSVEVRDTLDWLEEMKYAHLNDKRIASYAEKVLVRFGIISKETDPELVKQIADELLVLMKDYFPNYEPSEAVENV